MRLPVVVLLLLAPYALAATPSCTPSQSVFALTDASAPSCLGIEMGNQWSRIVVDQQANCSYSVLGNSAQLDQPETAARKPYFPVFAFPTSRSMPYKTSTGATRQWTSMRYVAATDDATNKQVLNLNGTETTVVYSSDFKGFTNTLTIALPQYEFGTPGNYKYRQIGSSRFTVTQPPTKCTYTYTIVKGAFGGMKPSKESASTGACPKGMAKTSLGGTGAFACTFCIAGTYAERGACKACPRGTVSTTAGATQCTQVCGPHRFPGIGATACVPCTGNSTYYAQGISTSTSPYQNNTRFEGGAQCKVQQCPANTLASSASNACFGGTVTGEFCETSPVNTCGNKGRTPIGGAAMVLQKADTSAPACKAGVVQLAAWLPGQTAWLGFNMSSAPFTKYERFGPSAIYGLNLGLTGNPERSPFRAFPGSVAPFDQTSVTTSTMLLDARTGLFSTILASNDTSSGVQGWGIMAEPGDAPGTILTRWFQDNLVAQIATSVMPMPPTGVCELTFKVVAGSALGVAPTKAAPCPKGTVTIKQADGSSSCVMCGPGYFATAGNCKPCTGNSYSNEWGQTQCKPCAKPYPGPNSYGSGNFNCNRP